MAITKLRIVQYRWVEIDRVVQLTRWLLKYKHFLKSSPVPCKQIQHIAIDPDYQPMSTWRLWGEEKVDGAVYLVYLKKVRYHRPSKSVLSEVDDDKISHLEWETVRVRSIKAGSLDRLVEALCTDCGELESSYSHVFFSTYRTFSTAKQVLHLLLENYKRGHSSFKGEYKEEYRRCIRQALHVWLDSYPEDFCDPPHYSTMQQMVKFCQSYLHQSELHLKVKEKLDVFRREEEFKGSTILEAPGFGGEMRCVSPIPAGTFITGGNYEPGVGMGPRHILDVPEEHFAAQLTRMDANLFRRVIPHQCLGSIWSRRDRSIEAATVSATVEQFNAVSFRVISTILMDLDLKPMQRARIISKWIDIAQELRLLKNFSSLKAIISGLQSNPIYRLRKVWAMVARERVEIYEELARIFSEDNNALTQRELLQREGTAKHANAVGDNDRQMQRFMQKHSSNNLTVIHGTIPYLGTFLTDLMMIDTAIPDTMQPEGLINFDKRRREFEVLAQIKLLQGSANSYKIGGDSKFERWFDSLLVLEDKDSFDLSCVIESPGGSESTPASNSSSSSRQRKRAPLGHRKTDSITSTASSSSSSQFYLDLADCSLSNQLENCSIDRKMSTSSSNSSLPSLDVSINTSGIRSTHSPHKSDRSISVGSNNSPYRNPEFYIIRISIETSATEIQGQNLYKSIMLSNSERTPSVIRSAMGKHSIEGEDENHYTLSQIIPDGEILFPHNANVYYAINTTYDLNFILRKKKNHTVPEIHSRARRTVLQSINS